MAGIKSKAHWGQCLAVLQPLWAKIRSGKKECSEWEWGQPSKEKPAQPGTEDAVMALLTILHICLPPKHLTCSISHTNKQTNTHKHTDARGCLENTRTQAEESITQRPINPWLSPRTVSRHPLSTCWTWTFREYEWVQYSLFVFMKRHW